MLYKVYSLQLNCTYSNYTEAAATCSAAQQHSTFTVQILYSLQLNCTYSNYTKAAATCSAAQQHSCTNCTVYNWTVLTVIKQKLLLDVQLHNSAQTSSWCLLKCSAASCLIYLYLQTFTSSDQILQRNAISWQRIVTISHTHYTPHICSSQALAFCALIGQNGITNSGKWRVPLRWNSEQLNTITPAWRHAPAASAFLCHLPISTHSHWAAPATVAQEHAACGATRLFFQGNHQIYPRWEGKLIWSNEQLVFRWLGLSGPLWLSRNGDRLIHCANRMWTE
jgi:hypothetical protein